MFGFCCDGFKFMPEGKKLLRKYFGSQRAGVMEF